MSWNSAGRFLVSSLKILTIGFVPSNLNVAIKNSSVLKAMLCRLHFDQRQNVLLECHLVHNLAGTGTWVLAILSCEIPCEAVAVIDRGVDDRFSFIARQVFQKRFDSLPALFFTSTVISLSIANPTCPHANVCKSNCKLVAAWNRLSTKRSLCLAAGIGKLNHSVRLSFFMLP